jgi:hypothetical protein
MYATLPLLAHSVLHRNNSSTQATTKLTLRRTEVPGQIAAQLRTHTLRMPPAKCSKQTHPAATSSFNNRQHQMTQGAATAAATAALRPPPRKGATIFSGCTYTQRHAA